jgi:outer membrane lipoprotein-sorting protein
MLRKAIAGIALAALLASPVAAQTVDELIAKHVQALGGMEKIKSLTSMRTSGKMIMGQGMEAPFVMMQKRPKLSRMEFTFQGMTGVQAYDGKNGWQVMPFMGKKEPEAMPAEQNKLLDEQADMDGPLIDYKAKGNKIELTGKEQVEGADAYKLKVTLKDGQERVIYLDAESYLEVKTEAKRNIRGSEVETESFLSDYKDESGRMMPHTIESGVKGSDHRQKLVFEKVECNPALADSLFAMPAGTKPAAADTTKSVGAKADAAKSASTKPAAAKSTETKKEEAKKKP